MTVKFTKVPNDVLSGIIKSDMTSREIRVLLALIRRSFGWHKEKASIRLRDIAGDAGIYRQHVSGVIKALEKRNIVSKLVQKDSIDVSVLPTEKWVMVLPQTVTPVLPRTVTPKNDTVTKDGYDCNQGRLQSVTKDGYGNDPVTPDLFFDSEGLKKDKESKKEILPLKNRGSKNADTKKAAIGQRAWAIWVEVYRKLRGGDPVPMGADTKAGKMALEALNGDEVKLRHCYDNFLHDDDRYLASVKWPLREISKRLSHYAALGEMVTDGQGRRVTIEQFEAYVAEIQEMLRKGAQEP